MEARRKREQDKLHHNLLRLNRYIFKVADRQGWKSILFSAEDIVQECTIVLWRVIEKYPEARGTDLLKLFKWKLRRRLASMFRLEHVRRTMGTLHLGSFDGWSKESLNGEWLYDAERIEPSFQGVDSVMPWDFYKSKLRMIERKIGRKKLRDFLNQRNFGKGFENRKEAIMKCLE